VTDGIGLQLGKSLGIIRPGAHGLKRKPTDVRRINIAGSTLLKLLTQLREVKARFVGLNRDVKLQHTCAAQESLQLLRVVKPRSNAGVLIVLSNHGVNEFGDVRVVCP